MIKLDDSEFISDFKHLNENLTNQNLIFFEIMHKNILKIL